MRLAKFGAWLRSEQGQDLSEYALIIGLIVILAIGSITAISDSIQGVLSSISSTLQTLVP
jgi:Flp pilus assembly pilin Flp